MNIQDNTQNYVRRNEVEADDKKKKKIIIAGIIAIVVIIALIFAILWKKGYRTIKLFETFNRVSYDRDTQKNLDVYENMALKAGDTLRTGDGGSFARLVLDDDKYVYIEENSEVAFEMAGRKSNSRTTLHLNYGAIFNELENELNDKQSYEIKSPNSLMAVRGTKFRVSTYIGSDGILYTRVSVLEGKVECWLIYPDGSISTESHIADVGNEILIYYDEESGITDFARINEAGRYNSKIVGEYQRSISFAQMPMQALTFMALRAYEEGGSFDAITADELSKYAALDEALREEPILERYGVSEKELIEKGLLDRIQGDELADVSVINPKWNLETGEEDEALVAENSDEEEALDSIVVDNSGNDDSSDAGDNSESNNEEVVAENSKEVTQEKVLTPEEQLLKQIEELLKNPEVVAALIKQQEDKRAAEEAAALAAQQAYQTASSSDNSYNYSSDGNDNQNASTPTPSTPAGGGGGTPPGGGGTPGTPSGATVTVNASGKITSSPITNTTIDYDPSGNPYVVNSDGSTNTNYQVVAASNNRAASNNGLLVIDTVNHQSYSGFYDAAAASNWTATPAASITTTSYTPAGGTAVDLATSTPGGTAISNYSSGGAANQYNALDASGNNLGYFIVGTPTSYSDGFGEWNMQQGSDGYLYWCQIE